MKNCFLHLQKEIKMFPKYTYLFAIICLISTISSCNNGSSEQQIVANLKPAKGGKNFGGIYRVNMVRGNPNALDPVLITSKLASDISSQIYDHLLTFDSNMVVKPELAKSWEISPDGLLYTFHLRTDAFFHDNKCFPNGKGRKVIASDVVYSLSRSCDPTTKTAHFWAFKDKVVGATEYYTSRTNGGTPIKELTGLKALNDSTFTITLIQPYSPLLMLLGNSFAMVLPKEAVEYYKDMYFRNPVGSGPFVFSEWKDDMHILLKRNPNYWEYDNHNNRLPFLNEIEFSFIKDDKIQFSEFMKGSFEESYTIPTEFFDNVVDPSKTKTTKAYRSVTLQAEPALLTWMFHFNTQKYPYNNVYVRRAFAYAIDKEKIVRYVLRNSPYKPGNHGITPPVIPAYPIDSIKGMNYNPTLALENMAKAGYPNGQNFPEITLFIYQEPKLVQVAEAIQQMLTETLNIKVRLQIIQFSEFLQYTDLGKLPFWGSRWYGDYPDPENYIMLWDGSTVPSDTTLPSYPNNTRYNNPTVNSLLQQAVQTHDPAKQYALYRQAEQLATNDVPSIILFYEMHYRLLQPYVKDNPMNAMNLLKYKYVWFGA